MTYRFVRQRRAATTPRSRRGRFRRTAVPRSDASHLARLLARCLTPNPHEEVDWGPPVRREIW